MKKECPSCGEPIYGNKCKGCGYVANEQSSSSDNRICAYTQNGRRCDFLGNRTDTTKPDQNTKWFCSDHYIALNDAKLGALVFDMMDRGEIVRNKKDWRDEMIDQKIAGRTK